MEIKSIVLKRNRQQDLFHLNEIKSKLYIKVYDTIEWKTYVFNVKENLKYIFPPGRYYLQKEHSPKFKTNLWEFYGISGRSEIKFHSGNKPEHSKGCPYMDKVELDQFDRLLSGKKIYSIKVVN